MQSTDWFPRPAARKAGNELLAAALKGVVGLAVAALFYLRGHLVLAAVAGGFALVFFALSLSPKGRAAIGKLFGFVGEWAGRIVGSVLLSAIFVLVLTPVRLVRRLAGADDLRLRHRKESSYWLACDPEEHKRRYAGAMFATEATEPGGRRGVLILVAIGALLIAGEVGLRVRGHGHPLLYVSDPATGYRPAPGQDTRWRGAHLVTNGFGMRAPEREVARPAGVFRVLALGSDGGLRVDQEALYARQLERALGEKSRERGARPIEVWNADAAGWGPAAMRGYVADVGTFEADVVLVTLVPGALGQPLQGLLQTPFSPTDRPPRLALEELLGELLWDYRDGRTPRDPAGMSTLRRRGAAEVVDLVKKVRAGGADAQVFVIAPEAERSADERAPFVQLQGELAANGASYRELPGSFARGALDPDDGSLTAAGHHDLAAVMAAELIEHSPKLRAWLGATAP